MIEEFKYLFMTSKFTYYGMIAKSNEDNLILNNVRVVAFDQEILKSYTIFEPAANVLTAWIFSSEIKEVYLRRADIEQAFGFDDDTKRKIENLIIARDAEIKNLPPERKFNVINLVGKNHGTNK